MTPYYADDWLTVYHGDARAVMAELPAESVHCVVTSPPYWGLRDYGTATWTGGDEGCDHAVGGQVAQTKHPAEGHTTGQRPEVDASRCRKCGATRVDSQLGLEPTPEAYVENMAAVFREVWRVLRRDGTVWLNLGDSYAAGGSRQNGYHDGRTNRDKRNAAPFVEGLKPKDLVGIPWRVAFALQADGWYLRSDIIWSKPNPMPESVTDRFTSSYEHVFMLAKSDRYFFDQDAVREPHLDITLNRVRYGLHHKHPEGIGVAIPPVNTEVMGERFAHPNGRNRRDVWTIPTVPYKGAHFATFPPKLVEPCIKAGCPEGSVVLDPFAGSGTTGMVAQSLSRRAVLIDLSMDYLGQLMDRNRDIPLGLAQ